jgi:cell division septation protein DedD
MTLIPRTILLRSALLATVVLGGHAAILPAQESAFPTTPRFQAIIRLAQDGRSDSARAVIGGIITATDPADPSYAEALYTAATIASSGDEARLLFSRVAVEFPRSGWGDKALLRLAQLDYGAGDSQGTVDRVERLMTTYPQSTILADAALWGARAAIERQDMPRACSWLDRGLAQVGQNVELRNQIEFTRRRCTTTARNQVATPPAETPMRTPETRPVDRPEVKAPPTAQPQPARPAAIPATPPPPPPAPAPQATGPWRVQVAAVSDPAAITRMERAIRGMGLTTYRTPAPGGLTRVQAGPFATREAAQERVADLARAVGGQPFVTRVP